MSFVDARSSRDSWRGHVGSSARTVTTPSSSPSSKIDDLSQWTSKQWHRAKAEWKRKREMGRLPEAA